MSETMNPLLAVSLLLVFGWVTLILGIPLLFGLHLQLPHVLGEPVSTIVRFLIYGASVTAWLTIWFKLAKLYLTRQLKRRFPTPLS